MSLHRDVERDNQRNLWTVEKEFRFEAAHRLVQGYSGKCAHLHGHSWIVKVRLTPKSELNQYGMTTDFGDFIALRTWVDSHLDHSTILAVSDPLLPIFQDQGVVEVGERALSFHFYAPRC